MYKRENKTLNEINDKYMYKTICRDDGKCVHVYLQLIVIK